MRASSRFTGAVRDANAFYFRRPFRERRLSRLSGPFAKYFLFVCCWFLSDKQQQMVPQPAMYAEPIDVFIGTWNLGDAIPAANIDAWLHPREFDLYVISAQEAGYDLEKVVLVVKE
jgi:hypothetical protein